MTGYDDQSVVEKACTKCGFVKSLDDFHRNADGRHGRKAYCKTCVLSDPKGKQQRVDGARRWRLANPDRANEIRLKRYYGISLEEFNDLLAQQDGACGVCRAELTDTPHVDHDHKTGEVRGLLCGKCNRGLGMFDDDPAMLRRAAEYLEASRG